MIDMILKWLYQSSAAIIITSLISLLISMMYYRKGNRDELFDRIVSILDNPEKAEALIKEDNYSKFLNLFFEY